MIKTDFKLKNSEFIMNKPLDAALFVELVEESDGVALDGGFAGDVELGFYTIEHAVQAIAEPLLKKGIDGDDLEDKFIYAVMQGLSRAFERTSKTSPIIFNVTIN